MARRSTPSPAVVLSPEHTRRRLVELKPHPHQEDWFSPLPEQELQALAESLQRVGLQHPIHITPDNVILAGHQRFSAAQLLGWSEIDAIIRHDLAADETAAALFAIGDNLHRRQMGPLELAVAYRGLRQVENEHSGGSGAVPGEERQDLRDRLARHFGRSGRQLDRYLRLLDLPPSVQIAISQRRLPVSMAERLFSLDDEQRRAVSEAIAGGEDPKAAVQQVAPVRKKQRQGSAIQRPGLANSRANIQLVIRFLRSGFDDYVAFIERMGGDNALYLERLVEVRAAVDEMLGRPGAYVREARQLL